MEQLFNKLSWIKRDKLMRVPWRFKSCLFPFILLAVSGCGVAEPDEISLSEGTVLIGPEEAPVPPEPVPPEPVPPEPVPPEPVPLAAPVVNLGANGDSTILDWNNSNANQYRVLYWQGNENPQEHMTNSTTYTLPPLSSGVYTVIVEAYDALGNSLFSTPVTVRVI